MDYINLSDKGQLDEVDRKSAELPNGALIFKHSKRCAISMMALGRFSRGWDYNEEDLPIYHLDLIQHRDVSNEITNRYKVMHESPQILLIKDGKCVYSTSHTDITPYNLKSAIDG